MIDDELKMLIAEAIVSLLFLLLVYLFPAK